MTLDGGDAGEIRRRLSRTWRPFFGKFRHLLPIQSLAVPQVLAGLDVLACAPTASGKTEAVIAPVLERLLESCGQRSLVVYVAPTRALVNDMDRRLEGPCGELGIRTAVRTGDRRELDVRHPPGVLLTTPESLDSLLCRAPGVFRGARWAVLDEIHQLDGNYRGDQLRVLLRRMEGEAGGRVQVAAMSATAGEPDAMAARYMREPSVLRAGEARGHTLHVVAGMEEAVAVLKGARRHKAVWFCNKRADAEDVAARLARDRLWPADAVFVHHGSLGRSVREKVEKSLRQREWGICSATMTLELGIDIGDISAVVLWGAPPTASAFQQRVGRACRREGSIFIVGVAEAEWEAALFRTYVRMAEDGEVESEPYAPDPSVVVQQLLSILYGKPCGVEPRALRDALAPLLHDRGHWWDAAVDHLEQSCYIRRGPRVIQAATTAMDMGERGLVHSNIPDSGEFDVVDASTGRAFTRALLEVGVGSMVALAGRMWEVVAIKGKKVTVAQRQGAAAGARFGRRTQPGAFWHLLPESMRSGPGQALSTSHFS